MVDLGSDPEELQWLLDSTLEQSAEQEPRPLLMLQWQQPEQQEPQPQQQEPVVRQPGLEQQQQPVEPEQQQVEPVRHRLLPVADLFAELPGEAAAVAGADRQPRPLARSPAVRRSTRSLRQPTVEGLGKATRGKGGRI